MINRLTDRPSYCVYSNNNEANRSVDHSTSRQVAYFMTAKIKKIVVLFLQSVDDVFVLLGDLLYALNAKILDTL